MRRPTRSTSRGTRPLTSAPPVSSPAVSCSRPDRRTTRSCWPRPRPWSRSRWRVGAPRSRPPPRVPRAASRRPPCATKAAPTARGADRGHTCAPARTPPRTSRWWLTRSPPPARLSSAPTARPSSSTMSPRGTCGCPTRTWSSWTTGTRSRTSSKRAKKSRTARSSPTRWPTRSSARKIPRPRPLTTSSASARGAPPSCPSWTTTQTWTGTC